MAAPRDDHQLNAGLRFLNRVASRSGVFRCYGADLLFCFYSFGITSPRSTFQRRSLRTARRLARRWRATHTRVASRARPTDLHYLMIGHGAASRLGWPDPRFHRRLSSSVGRFSPVEVLLFDPRHSAPPRHAWQCDRCSQVQRGPHGGCPVCRGPLIPYDLHEIWLDAILFTHFGAFAGIEFGSTPAVVHRWLPHYRRGLRRSLATLSGYPNSVLAVTHLVYALTDYGRVRATPGAFGVELRLLRRALPRAIEERDVEVVAEIVEVLHLLDVSLRAPLLRPAVALLRSHQNRDGSWGPPAASWYTRYHATWTCLDALRPRRVMSQDVAV